MTVLSWCPLSGIPLYLLYETQKIALQQISELSLEFHKILQQSILETSTRIIGKKSEIQLRKSFL